MKLIKFADIFDSELSYMGELIPIYDVDLTVNIVEWINYHFSDPKNLCVVLFSKQTKQYLIFIREHGLYSSLFKTELTVGFLSYDLWLDRIVVDGGRFLETDNENITPFENARYFICSNPKIAIDIIRDLYLVMSDRIINWLLYKVDELLIELHNESQNNQKAATLVKTAFEESTVNNGDTS